MRIANEATVILRQRSYQKCVAEFNVIEHRVKKYVAANDGGLPDDLAQEFEQIKSTQENAFKQLSKAQTTLSMAA